MRNEWRFACPVAEGVVCAQECANTHDTVMIGRARDVEPRCAIAHRAGKCIWAILERRSWQAGQPVPFSAKETAPQKVSDEIVNQALSAGVFSIHYQGIAPSGSHDEFFSKLTAHVPHVEAKVRAPRRIRSSENAAVETPAPVVKLKPKTALDAIQNLTDDRAEVLNRRIASEAQGSAQSAKSVPEVSDTQKVTKPASDAPSRAGEVSNVSSNMTLAERIRARQKG